MLWTSFYSHLWLCRLDERSLQWEHLSVEAVAALLRDYHKLSSKIQHHNFPRVKGETVSAYCIATLTLMVLLKERFLAFNKYVMFI